MTDYPFIDLSLLANSKTHEIEVHCLDDRSFVFDCSQDYLLSSGSARLTWTKEKGSL